MVGYATKNIRKSQKSNPKINILQKNALLFVKIFVFYRRYIRKLTPEWYFPQK